MSLKDTYKIFKKNYKLNVKIINASYFFKKLKNITNPEKKEK